MPALSAGPSLTTELPDLAPPTYAPFLTDRLYSTRTSGVIAKYCTPTYAFWILPLSSTPRTKPFVALIGIANPILCASETIAVFMPMT